MQPPDGHCVVGHDGGDGDADEGNNGDDELCFLLLHHSTLLLTLSSLITLIITN